MSVGETAHGDEVRRAKREQAGEDHHLREDHHAVGGADQRVQPADVTEREAGARRHQHADGAERHRRETLQEPRRPRPLGGAEHRHEKMEQAAEPDGGRELVERVEGHQGRAMAGARRRVARPGAGDDETQRAGEQQRPADARLRRPAQCERAEDEPPAREHSQRAGPDEGRGRQLARVPAGLRAECSDDDAE